MYVFHSCASVPKSWNTVFFSVINSAALNTNVHVGLEMSKSCPIAEEDLPLHGVAQGKL